MRFQSALSSLVVASAALQVRAAVLVDFQVAPPPPPPVPSDAQQCTQVLIEHTFGNSFGSPAIANFTPPTDCGDVGSWAGISLNLTATSNGTQFDRLGVFTFQNTEIWRTSTPEPTSGDGIIWTYLKDVTRFIPLFSSPGEFIFELDNLIDIENGMDGQYAATVSMTFFASSSTIPAAKKSNLIMPISAQTGGSPDDNAPSVPPAISVNVTFPKNTIEVYAELFASGNGDDEEFWYFDTANEFLGDLPSGATSGDGPFREVRLLIDGMVAGVAFPYVVIFTGGIVPSSWRPITSYGALDLPTYFFDLTPFAPLLADGAPHNISLDVASAETDHSINDNWFVSGLVQVVTDPSGAQTTGNITLYDVDAFATTNTTGVVGANGDVNVTVAATHSVHIEATVVSGSGDVNNVVVKQEMAFSKTQNYLDNTLIQNVFQLSNGSVSSTHNGVEAVTDTFSFPFNINLTFLTPSGNNLTAVFDHSYDRTILPAPFLLGSTINEHQLATGFFNIASTGNTGNGTSTNTLTYTDTEGNTYDREVTAVLNKITADHQGGTLAPAPATAGEDSDSQHTFVGQAVRLPGTRMQSIQGNGQ